VHRILDVATSFAASASRLGGGLRVEAPGARPEQPVQLYEFEGCPYCRKVREVLTALDLEADVRPCPKGGTRFRPEVRERGGKEQFPWLVDPNTGAAMYESEAIIDYRHDRYGRGRPRALRWLSPLNTVSAAVASAARPRGREVRRPRPDQPDALIELYNFEASPYCRKVREALAALDLDYLVRNVAKKSARRPELVARGGKMQVPYLVDPNTGAAMYESDEIVAYLRATYGEISATRP